MKESKITNEQIVEEMQGVLSNPQLRKCSQCVNAKENCTWCSQLKKPIAQWMYAGLCKYFETDEERIIRQAREDLEKQEKEEHKINRLLTMALNCIDVSMLFLEDFAQRVEKEYRIADKLGVGKIKDRKADRAWIANLKKANKAMINNIDGARKQFQHYVMPIYNALFYNKDVKRYDVEMYDDHQSDCTELAHLVLRYFNVALMNEENSKSVFDLMKSMDSCGVMEESDFNHYKFRR